MGVTATNSSPDAYLETLIEIERERMVEAPTVEARRDAWQSMKALIGSRSPQQVRRMERARGLR